MLMWRKTEVVEDIGDLSLFPGTLVARSIVNTP